MSEQVSLSEWRVNEDLSIMPLTPNEAVQRRALLVAFIRDAMKEGRDYGIIPGTNEKSLWKAGAEKLCSFFGYSFQVQPVESVMDWTGKNTDGEPFFFFRHKCILRHGAVLIGESEASCNSFEKKYRWREAKRKCPKCHRETVYRSRPRKDDPPNKPMGFYCWEKKSGCGTQFAPNDQSITSQQVGMVKNDEIFDQVNTIQKMSEKRALVGTTIIACNASEFFVLANLDDDDDVIDGDFRPAVTKDEALTKDEIKAKAAAASASLRGDQGDLGPELKDSYTADQAGNGNKPAPESPKSTEWPTSLLNQLVMHYKGGNIHEYRARITKSAILKPDDKFAIITHWMDIYNTERVADIAPDEAARRADADRQATKESA